MSEAFDVIVVGAGFAGMNMLMKLRKIGMSALVVERGSDVGGTWYWNRYPGARCDVPSLDYSVPWDEEADQEWNWSERYSTQPEILEYIRYLADRNDVRKDMRFNTAVTKMTWDEARRLWIVGTDKGDVLEARYVVSGAGALSEPNMPDIPGIGSFAGELYHTGRWPREGVDLKGKRVAVLGTGSTGVQASTAIAAQADHLYVLQRTAQYSLPCHSPALTEEQLAEHKAAYPQFREAQRHSYTATTPILKLPFAPRAADHQRELRFENYERLWNTGTNILLGAYGDVSTNPEVAQELSDFVRDKIRAKVKDPVTAEKLCPPEGSYIGTRRIIIDTGYYEIFNQSNVTLVDIRADPIVEITPTGIKTENAFHPIDVLVVATGYDAVSGPLLKMNITGQNGLRLDQAWADGPHSYLGLMVAGFPNLFTITGPSSPGVLANVIFSIEQHVEWIGDCLDHLRSTGATRIEATEEAQREWQAHAMATVAATLRFNDDNNWYLGTNVPGKPRAVLVYQGGLKLYRDRCDEIAAQGYRGFDIAREEQVAA